MNTKVYLLWENETNGIYLHGVYGSFERANEALEEFAAVEAEMGDGEFDKADFYITDEDVIE